MPAAKSAAPDHPQQLRDIDGLGLLFDLCAVLALHLFALREHLREYLFQQGGINAAAIAVILLGDLAQRIGGGEGKRRARGRAAQIAEQSATDFAEQSAD